MELHFTDREISILEELVKGKSYKEIAQTLYISISTVKHYMGQISDKIGIRRKINIILYILSNNCLAKQSTNEQAQ